MSARTTKSDVQYLIERINSHLSQQGRELRLGIDYAYGGARVVSETAQGAQIDMGHRCSLGAVYDQLYLLDNVLSGLTD